MTGSLQIRSVEPADADAVDALFVEADIPCFCQFFQFEGDNKQWQDRCANARQDNASLLRRQLGEGSLEALVAYSGSRLAGWVRIAAPAEMSKTYQGRLYRGLPCFEGERADIRAVTCFLVRPKLRRQGVARELLAAAVERAKVLGATAIEAFPRGASDVTDEEQWTGPLGMYQAAGFETVHDFRPYPVLRLELSPGCSK